MSMSEDSDRVRLGRRLPEFHLVPHRVHVTEELLDGVARGTQIDPTWREASVLVVCLLICGQTFTSVQCLFAQLKMVKIIVAPDFVFLALPVHATVDAFFIVAEFLERLADLPAQGFQGGVPRALLPSLPLCRRVEAGIAPDVAHGRGLMNV